MIKAACRWKRRSHLSHRRSDDQRKNADERPANSNRSSARRAKTDMERSNSPRQNADDRKRDRKIGEAAHPPGQLLFVAKALEQLLVMRSNRLRRRWRIDDRLVHHFCA